MKLHMLNLKGEKQQEITLPKIFVENLADHDVLTQYIRFYTSNKRQGTNSVKTRGEVSGSGVKPWRQKGTGRARVGDKRTPIWRHGGIVHGPKPKSWNLVLNKKMKKSALITALGLKIRGGNLAVITSLAGLPAKTKDASAMLKPFNIGRKLLIINDKLNDTLRRGLKNIPNVSYADVSRLNAYQVLEASKVLTSKSALEALEKRLEAK